MSDNSIREVPIPTVVHVAHDVDVVEVKRLQGQGYRVVVTRNESFGYCTRCDEYGRGVCAHCCAVDLPKQPAA